MIELIQAGEEQRELLWNINQKYLYEMTNFYADELDEAGVLHYGHFEDYFTDPAREALLLYADGILVGFAMLCPYSQLEEPVDYVMAEFTVFPMYRRRGLALEAAQRILEVRPGRWEIKYNEKNAAAKALWTKLTTPYAPRKTRFSDVETVLQFTINQGRKHNADEVRFDASSLSANYSEKGSLARYQELNSVFPHTGPGRRGGGGVAPGGGIVMETWAEMRAAALAVQRGRQVSPYVEAGGVAAAILSASGRIYTGVCVDTCSTLGICAERNAIFHMLTCGEQEIRRVLAIMPDGRTGAPCGACRELMVQLMPETYRDIEIMLDWETLRVVTLGDLTPEWWI